MGTLRHVNGHDPWRARDRPVGPTCRRSTHREVQQLPFGPIRADVLESAEFTFFYIGEQIIHYQPQLFFKHRGMEKRFEGCPHRSSGRHRRTGLGGGNGRPRARLLSGCRARRLPARRRSRQVLRVLLAELERLYNHLHYLGHLCNTTTLKVGEAQGKLLEEKAKQINGGSTGSRFLRSLLAPGGLRRDLAPGAWLARGAGRPARGIRRLCRAARASRAISTA